MDAVLSSISHVSYAIKDVLAGNAFIHINSIDYFIKTPVIKSEK